MLFRHAKITDCEDTLRKLAICGEHPLEVHYVRKMQFYDKMAHAIDANQIWTTGPLCILISRASFEATLFTSISLELTEA